MRTYFRQGIALGATVWLSACAGTPSERVPESAAAAQRRSERSSVPSARPISDKYPMQVGDYLIWPVKHDRAEDLAATLEPFFRSRYGDAVRIVPHIPTNKLLIYIPPPHLRDDARGPAGVGRVPGAAGTSRR